MYKDPTEFRARFKAYKEGKMPYENGLPKFAGGTPGLTSTQQAALDDMYNYFNPLGYDIISISGMGGNGLLESGLNPDIVSKSGYAGVWQNNKNLQNAIKDMYGDHSKDNLFRYANAWVNGDRLIRKGKHAAHTALGSGKFKKAGYKTAEEAADAWLKNYERAVILDSNGKVIGYQDQGKRKAFAKAAYNYLSGKYGKGLTAVVPEPIIEQAVSTAVRNTIPAEQTHTTWEGAHNVSPYLTGKPMLRPIHRVKLPNLIDVLEDDLWEPGFPGLKNGKLPCFEMGTPEGVDMGEKRSTPISIEQVRNTPHEQGMSGTDPIGKFVVESVGMTKGAKILGDILSAARLRRMADTYRNLRKYDQDILNYTGKSLRKLNIQFADKIARDGFLYSRPENPLYWILDPIMTGYTKLQSHPVIGPLIPFKNGKIPEYKNGKSSIHIKPANRGKFTALKKRTGHYASWFKLNGTPAQKKMATFALNAKKWKH